ncbi:MAG: hypothetical protein GY785_24455 [Gammaproteobacteria bacterium]|nr:hypothetical protein [Gammaproteobacteria bacterium]
MDDLREIFISADADNRLLNAVHDQLQNGQRNRTLVADELCKLHNEKSINVVAAYNSLKNSPDRPDFFFTRHVFETLLPNLEADVLSVMKCVIHLVKEAGHDGAASMTISPYIEYCAKKPSRPAEALKLIKTQKAKLYGALTATLIAGARHDERHYVEEAIRLVVDTNMEIRECAIFSLGKIRYCAKGPLSHDALAALAKAAKKETDDTLLCTVVRSTFDLYLQRKKPVNPVTSIISTALDKGDAGTLHAASEIIGFHLDDMPVTLLKLLIQHFGKVNPDHKGTLDNIDYGLAKLLSRDDPKIGINLLETLLLSNNSSISMNAFDSAKHELLNKLATRWLSTGNPAFCTALYQVVKAGHKSDLLLNVYPLEIGNHEFSQLYFIARKAGDLTRNDWDGDAIQSLRPSLNEILDSYIPNRLPPEHKSKPVIICLCFGGDVREQVRPALEGYKKQVRRRKVSFSEWNGDKLSGLILTSFLRGELLPENTRSDMRKALALIDEPQASFQHFSALIRGLSDGGTRQAKADLTALRQINICLWIHFAWSREANNIEASYLSGELAVLYSWEITKYYAGKKSKLAKAIQATFYSIFSLYHQICSEFLEEKVFPFVNKRHALSVAVHGNCDLDVNLRLFDILGRVALNGLWIYSLLQNTPETEEGMHEKLIEAFQLHVKNIKYLIANNPTLKLPIKDDQAIDITLAMLLLLLDGSSNDTASAWMREIMNRAQFAFRFGGKYPCDINTYLDLLDHPVADENYLKENTCGSILYPMLGVFAEILDDEQLYKQIQEIQNIHLEHCNFQLWFPSAESEEHFYMNSEGHGAVLSEINVNQPLQQFANQVFGECEYSKAFYELSAQQFGFWPLILVACRLYRLPVPIHLFRDPRPSTLPTAQASLGE